MARIRKSREYGAFIWDSEDECYKCLSITECSAKMAMDKAVAVAEDCNTYMPNRYRIGDAEVRVRELTTFIDDWTPLVEGVNDR